MSDLDGSLLIQVDPLPMPFSRSPTYEFALRRGPRGYELWRMVADAYHGVRYNLSVTHDEYELLLRSQAYNLASFGYALAWDSDPEQGGMYLIGRHNTTGEFLFFEKSE